MRITIDIGGTNCRVAGFPDLNDPANGNFQMSFPMTKEYSTDIKRLIDTINDYWVRQGHDPIEEIGIAIAGALNTDHTEVVAAGNLAHWVGRPFKGELENQFQVPVTVGNDAYCNTLAELVFTDAPNDVLGITWGSGVGGCFGRKPAEPGHVIVDPFASNNPDCGCGRKGCLESFAGGAKIEQKYGVEHAGLIDAPAQNEVINAMASGLTSILCAHPAPEVIFSGGVGIKQPGWVVKIHDRVSDQYRMGSMPEFRVATFGERTGLIGALALLKDQN